MATTFKGKCATALGVGPTTIYTAPGATTTLVTFLSITNILGAAITAGARMTDSSAAVTAYIGGRAFSIPVGGAEIVITKENPVTLETGDSISIDGSTAVSMDYVLSYVEIT
jgi:hypothetical protein